MGIKNITFNKAIAFAIALVTLLASVIAFLQGDAAARDDRANRESKQYAIQAFGKQISGEAHFSYDLRAYHLAERFELQSIAASNRGDDTTALRNEKLAKEITQFSPLLAPPYGKISPDGTFNVDVPRYESDLYVVETTKLRELYMAASEVKDKWDYKANTYIKHITLLAVALFLFGLSTTLSQGAARWIFAASGLIFSLGALGWAIYTMITPVFDLREQGNAIQNYAEGIGLSYQEKYKEAIAAFDRAIQAYPAYTNALVGRAEAYSALEDYSAAAKDYEEAIRAGDQRYYVAGDLGWTYFMLGNFDDAVTMTRQALEKSPDELWLRFQLGLLRLVRGEVEAAQQEYQQGMDAAVRQVAEAKAANQEPPSYLWWGLEDGASTLEYIIYHIETPQKYPPIEKIVKPQEVKKVAQELAYKLNSLAVSLEYIGKPPQPTTAKLSPLKFAAPIVDENGEVMDYSEPTDHFKVGLDEVGVLFDYENMKNGMSFIMKLYIDGIEDPSWRIVQQWDLGEKGEAVIPLSYAFSDAYTFAEGEYTVQVYVDYQLLQQGTFYIEK